MVNGLLNHLNAETDIPFVFMAWSHSEERLYGIVTLSDQEELSTDHDSISEKMLEGYVDVFTKEPNGTEVTQVEACLRSLGILFSMESTQYENETGFIHYEWRWIDSNGHASEDVACITFVTHEGTTSQWVAYGSLPVAPTAVSWYDKMFDYENGGLWYCPKDWDSTVTPVNSNKTYTMIYVVGVGLLFKIESDWAYQNIAESSPLPVGVYPVTGADFTNKVIRQLVNALASGTEVYTVSTDGLHDKMISINDGLITEFMRQDGTRVYATPAMG